MDNLERCRDLLERLTLEVSATADYINDEMKLFITNSGDDDGEELYSQAPALFEVRAYLKKLGRLTE